MVNKRVLGNIRYRGGIMEDVHIKLTDNIHRELIIELDSLGTITSISPNCRNILGYDIDEIVGVNISDLIVDGNIPFEKCKEENFEITLRSKNGEAKSFDTMISINHNEEVNGALISLIDLDRLQRYRLEDRKLLDILELSKDIIYMVQLKPEVRMLYMNSAVEEIIGIKLEDHYKDPFIPLRCAHPDDVKWFMKKINDDMDYSNPIHVRFKNVHGEYIWLEESIIPIYNEEKELVALVGYCRNIQARKELEERLKKIGYYDCLTGIRNRTYFQNELDNLHTRVNKEIGIIVCDLDNLKEVNDSFGHLRGDELLKNFGQILDKFSSEKIVTARVGGDEFAILIKGEYYDFLEDIYYKLLKSIENYNNYMDFPIEVSIGFAYSHTSIGNTKKVYSEADKRMYQDKLSKKEAKEDQ